MSMWGKSLLHNTSSLAAQGLEGEGNKIRTPCHKHLLVFSKDAPSSTGIML